MWSRLELVLRSLLQEQSGVPWPVFSRLTAGMSMDAILDATGSLMEMEGDLVRREKFRVTKTRTKVLAGRRNRAVHSTWVWGDTGGYSALDLLSRRSRSGEMKTLFNGGLMELEQLANEIHECAVDFNDLIRDPSFPRLDRLA
jgi:hypothetical protein